MSEVFHAYAAYYDLLYKGKDYAGEVAYLHALIQQHAGEAKDLLELGCGTGIHAAHFAQLGYRVHGIDRSEEMLARASAMVASLDTPIGERVRLEQGDVRSWRGPRRFDVVLSLFHVFSYQISDADVHAAFATAAAHLDPGGLLAIDFWYGPAVQVIGPEARVKNMENGAIRVTRRAVPKCYHDLHRVDVHYEVSIEDCNGGGSSHFHETHHMRYFFKPELRAFLEEAGLQPILFREWLTDKEPSSSSWNAMLVARRRG